MLKKLNPEIALGFFVASIFWIAVVGWQASYTPTEKQKDECYETAKRKGYKADECKGFWEKVTSDPIALFNLILAFSTVGLWGATISLYLAGDRQLRLARDEFDAVHRPKIRIKHLWLTTDVWEGEGVEATVVFVNTGMTPAILLELNFGTCLLRSGRLLPADPNWIKEQTATLIGQRPLEAGMTVELNGLNDGRILKDLDNVAIREGQSKLYFAGAIEYKDRRGAIRKTAFCRVLSFDTDGGQRGRFLRFADRDYEYED